MDAPKTRSSGRVVIVTGAGKGLGRAFALAAAAEGAKVVVNNRRRSGEDSSADEVVAAIKARGGSAVAEYSDVCDDDAAGRIIDRALDAFQGLDALIFNAGVNGLPARTVDQGMDDFRGVMETNFFANVALVQAAAPALKASAAARLLFVASSAGLYGVRGRAPYAASKGALIALALTLAQELRRDGIGVNVLAPYAATQMTPAELNAQFGEFLTPDRVGPMAAWLVSEACRRTGEIWSAGGGYFRRARMEEGEGGRAPNETGVLEWISRNVDQLGDMTLGEGYVSADAALQDLVLRVIYSPA